MLSGQLRLKTHLEMMKARVWRELRIEPQVRKGP